MAVASIAARELLLHDAAITEINVPAINTVAMMRYLRSDLLSFRRTKESGQEEADEKYPHIVHEPVDEGV